MRGSGVPLRHLLRCRSFGLYTAPTALKYFIVLFLLVVGTEIGGVFMRLSPGKRRAGNHPLLAVLQIVSEKVRHSRTPGSTHDARIFHAGTGNGNQTLVIQNTATEEFADSKQILHVQMPDDFVRPNGLNEMDMGTDQTGRMYEF